MADIEKNYRLLRENISKEKGASPESDREVCLIAVSKHFPPESISVVARLGQKDFGENKVQEAQAKWPGLKKEFPACKLHLLGSLQTNKARLALELFDVIHTLDRPKLAHRLADLMAETGKRPDCLIQINIGEEPQKAGIMPGEAKAFIALCRDQLNLPVTGLMGIPPLREEPESFFFRLRQMAQENQLEKLSMGMSGDYKTAIAMGADYIRIGTAIFGPRPF